MALTKAELFSEFPYHRYEPVDFRFRVHLLAKKYLPIWLSDSLNSTAVLQLTPRPRET